jgi:hypothetical protein
MEAEIQEKKYIGHHVRSPLLLIRRNHADKVCSYDVPCHRYELSRKQLQQKLRHRYKRTFFGKYIAISRSAAARLLRLWVRIPPGTWLFECCECCVLSSLCDELISRLEGCYRLWCVVACDLQTSKMRRLRYSLGRSDIEHEKKATNYWPHATKHVARLGNVWSVQDMNLDENSFTAGQDTGENVLWSARKVPLIYDASQSCLWRVHNVSLGRNMWNFARFPPM